jgi:hypothetical protein
MQRVFRLAVVVLITGAAALPLRPQQNGPRLREDHAEWKGKSVFISSAGREEHAMKYAWILAAIVGLPPAQTGIAAQDLIPIGTIFPVTLDKDLNAGRLHSGQEIRAKIRQNIPGTQVHRGDKVIGHVSNANSSKDGTVRIEVRFDTIKNRGKLIPIQTNIRALASPDEISDAESSMYGPSDGIEAAHESTTQIGSGDLVYHGGGEVFTAPDEVIGKSTQHGVLVELRANPERHCRGAIGPGGAVQALWLFSSDACGVYGYENVRIEHAGRTDPVGTIVFVGDNGKLNIHSQSGLLLRVLGTARTDTANVGSTAPAER